VGVQTPNACRPAASTEGIVGRVDSVGRELDVHVAGTAVRFDVPPGCLVTLRGERVKLRLLQPRDRVRVAYTEAHGRQIAEVIEVQPTVPAPE
jgi:hypothetical protein